VVELGKEEYPLAYNPITHDTYMDDCGSGTKSLKETLLVTDQIQAAVGKGGYSLKGFTISGSDPPDHLTIDGKSITIFGLKWFSKEDYFQLNIGELNLVFLGKPFQTKDGDGFSIYGQMIRRITTRNGETF
jgi:hypothetical protein